jgi:transposase
VASQAVEAARVRQEDARDRGPYPIIVLSGEQGSAKSTLSAILRAVLDPNSAPLRALPREDRDLFIAAGNGHVLAFDNVPGVGALAASAILANAPDPQAFKSGGDFAAWLGATPKQNSTGGKEKFGSITKQGNRYIRRLLVLGEGALCDWLAPLRASKRGALGHLIRDFIDVTNGQGGI